jgi:hypothetical protein
LRKQRLFRRIWKQLVHLDYTYYYRSLLLLRQRVRWARRSLRLIEHKNKMPEYYAPAFYFKLCIFYASENFSDILITIYSSSSSPCSPQQSQPKSSSNFSPHLGQFISPSDRSSSSRQTFSPHLGQVTS